MKKFSIHNSAFSIAFCALALVLWCVGAFTAQRAQDSLRAVAARWPFGGVSPVQLEAQLDIFREDRLKNVPGLTLWQQHAAQTVTDGGEKSLRASVLELYGPVEHVRSDSYLLGSAPSKSSVKTCAVSEGAAFALWGGTNAAGQTLAWGEQEYVVQGVFRGDDSLIIVQAAPDSRALFPNMQLHFADGGGRHDAGREAATEFFARTNFGNPDLLDMPLLGWAFEMLAALPALFIGMWLLARLVVHGLRLRRQPRKLLYFTAPAILFVGIDIFLLRRMERIPAALIPSRWSDFSFWTSLAEEGAKRLKTWLVMPQAGDIAALFSLLSTALLIFASLLMITLCISKSQVRKPARALLACGGCVLLMFLMAAYYAGRGGLRISPAMWLMPCLWIAADCALSWWKGGAVLEKNP